jgi:hypothetical protein
VIVSLLSVSMKREGLVISVSSRSPDGYPLRGFRTLVRFATRGFHDHRRVEATT